jgi:hypothetical protein
MNIALWVQTPSLGANHCLNCSVGRSLVSRCSFLYADSTGDNDVQFSNIKQVCCASGWQMLFERSTKRFSVGQISNNRLILGIF